MEVKVIAEGAIRVNGIVFSQAVTSQELGHEPGLCVRCLDNPASAGWLVDDFAGEIGVTTSSICLGCMTPYERSIFHAEA